MQKIHFIGLEGTACGLPFTLDILLSGNPKRTTCRNCSRTVAHGKASSPIKKIAVSEYEQPELFETEKGK